MTCRVCHIPIVVQLFDRQNICRDCWNLKGRIYRANNKTRSNELAAMARIRHKASTLQRYFDKYDYIAKAKSKPCMDCRVEYPPYVMHFDHVLGSKVRILSHMKSSSKTRIDAEIAKCEVVCSNCHAERTERRRVNSVINKAAGKILETAF